MNKKLILSFIFLMMSIYLVSSSGNVLNIPDDITSFEEFKLRVLEANQDNSFLSIATSDYWGLCQQTCANLIFQGDCNPCQSGEVASERGWHPDSMSVFNTWTSAYSYCNDWLAKYDHYNQQAFCTVPTPECPGGENPGDKICKYGDVWECSSSGVLGFSNDCDFGCSNGNCEQEQCSDHVEKKCDGGSVYWYDSCGDRQEEYDRCESDEVCESFECVRVCDEGFIGEKLCSGSEVVQQYQSNDCSTDIKSIEQCDHACENSICTSPQCSPCLDPTSWSQCDGESMFRTNYKCDSTTDYNCVSFTEDTSCECGTSEQCNYDEVCDSSVCVALDCGDNEIADGNECIEIPAVSTNTIILVGAGVVLFIFMISIIFLMIGLKGGQNKKK